MRAVNDATRSVALAALLTCNEAPRAAAQSGTPAPAVLTLACHVFGGGYTIKNPDGAIVENGDGVAFAPTFPSLIRIDVAARKVRVAGVDLPHPAGAAAPVFVGLGPVRFRWGSAAYEVTPDADGFTIRSTSSSAIGSGPQAGRIMDAFTVGSCAAIPAWSFP